MEIRQLNLAAFGPFTNRTLDFNQGVGVLNLIYGPNEAGKSSALRGLKSLLYGIPERSTDNFVHTHEQLRIGGCLRTRDQLELCFTRRKGRKNTLLTPNGEPLDETALISFLQGVTPELFSTLFGIDHHALVRGGQEILEQKGEVGQALFAAALGSPALHTVLEQLDTEADSLFRPRGSTQEINAALKMYNGLRRELREASLSSHKWDEHCRALDGATKDLEQFRITLIQTRREVTRLKRIQRILPKLARRRELLRRLRNFSNVVVLHPDFGERRQAAIKEWEKAQELNRKARSRLKNSQDQLIGIEVRQEILKQSETLAALHERLGSHRKAMQDRPHREAERNQLRNDAKSLLRDIRPGFSLRDVETLRPVLARRIRITELGNQREVLVARVKQTDQRRHETKTQLHDARNSRQQLPEISPPDILRRAVAAARKMGDLDGAIASAWSDYSALEEQCTAELARLPLWNGNLAAIPRLQVPIRESIEHFEQDYEVLNQRVRSHQEKKTELTETESELEKQLDEIQRTGSVPTEQDLDYARVQRDQAWDILRRQWIDGEDVLAEARVLDPERALPEAYETRVAHADELADRLRREADRVHKQASLIARRMNCKQRLGELEKQLNDCTQQKSWIDADWLALWKPCGLSPQSPREMRAWLERFDKLRDKVEQLVVLRRKAEEATQKRSTHIKALSHQLNRLSACEEIPPRLRVPLNVSGRFTDPSFSGHVEVATLPNTETPIPTPSLGIEISSQALTKDGFDSATPLEAVLAVSEDTIAAIDDITMRREQLDKEIQNLERNLETAVSDHHSAYDELNEWRANWTAAIDELSPDPNTLPAEANSIIEKLRELFSKQSDADKLQTRIRGIDKDADDFRNHVSRVVAQVAPELADLSVTQAVERLNALLAENRSSESRRQQIEMQVQQAREDIQDAQATIDTMNDRLQVLCVDAQCNDPNELEKAELRSNEYQQLKSELGVLEREILEIGEGATLAELEQEAEGVDSDVLPGQIQELMHTIDTELEPRQTTLAEVKGREEKELELMDGSDRAAQLVNQVQATLAGIQTRAERYVRVRIAARVLRQEIERYRKENQGPLIKRASEHFAILTQGSFEELRTDFNEKDEPVLVGIRTNRERVHVDGMSSGTRDQLYLSLRLASLEKYMENSEPMPFIVDDILVHFDDSRAAATLGVLAELAKKTQVMLFTHHSRLVEQARELNESVKVHTLK